MMNLKFAMQVELSLPSCVSWFVYIVILYTSDVTFYFNFVFCLTKWWLSYWQLKGVEMYRNVCMLFWYECKYLFGCFNTVGEIKSALKDAEKAVVLDSKNPVGSILFKCSWCCWICMINNYMQYLIDV